MASLPCAMPLLEVGHLLKACSVPNWWTVFTHIANDMLLTVCRKSRIWRNCFGDRDQVSPDWSKFSWDLYCVGVSRHDTAVGCVHWRLLFALDSYDMLWIFVFIVSFPPPQKNTKKIAHTTAREFLFLFFFSIKCWVFFQSCSSALAD